MTNEGLMPPALHLVYAESHGRRIEKLSEGCAALGNRPAMEAYTDTVRTGAIDGVGIVGAWILWVDPDGSRQIRRWGENPYTELQEGAVPE
jgi:hypothetical protein